MRQTTHLIHQRNNIMAQNKERPITPQYTPEPDVILHRQNAEEWLDSIELLRSKQRIMQTNAGKIYNIAKAATTAWLEYNEIIDALVAKSVADELTDAEAVQLDQFQKLTPPEFVAVITSIFDGLQTVANGIYALDAGTDGKWIGIYRPPVTELIEE